MDHPSRLKRHNCITPMAVARLEFDQREQELRIGLMHCELGVFRSQASNGCYGSLAACRYLRPSTSAFGLRADSQSARKFAL